MSRSLSFALSLVGAVGSAAELAPISATTQQCIVVVTDSWTSSTATARCFERKNNSGWQETGRPIPVLLGRNGLAWGRGEMNHRRWPGPIKREGDDKAPAGVFKLGTAFGYAKDPVPTRLTYLPLTNNVVAVDDPKSRYYNQLIDKKKVRDPDWRSAENMILADGRYRWGIWVRHNEPRAAGAGSCIFLHVWKNDSTLTSGCTAMSKSSMVRLLGWLDPARDPLLIQLPRSIYSEVGPAWGLPAW